LNPLILHTPGEPAGIGPELLIKLAAQPSAACRVAVADAGLLERTAAHLSLPLTLQTFDGQRGATPANTLWLIPQDMAHEVDFGQPSSGNAKYLLDCLTTAVEHARGAHAALVTGPLNKAVINQAGTAFTGHTEFIAELCGGLTPVMMLTSGDLRVALATTHLALRDVPQAITPARLDHIMAVLEHDLRERFGIAKPRIQVCGLNPHAGEGGHLGDEELRVIEPALTRRRQNPDSCAQWLGPVPSDTAFTRERLAQCDAVLAMYHDQGLPTLKHAGFGNAVNVTLGLPVIRTSVDHGTALDIAGQGRADIGSLRCAEDMAITLATQGAMTHG